PLPKPEQGWSLRQGQRSWRAMDSGPSPDHHLQSGEQARRATPIQEDVVTIADKTVLVTGANRGIGQGLGTEAPRRRASRVYAGTRQPLTHPDGRVTPLTLDVTDPAQIQAAADQVEALDPLINNAGVFLFDDLSDRAALEHPLAVNLFGTWGVTQAFLPLLTRSAR